MTYMMKTLDGPQWLELVRVLSETASEYGFMRLGPIRIENLFQRPEIPNAAHLQPRRTHAGVGDHKETADQAQMAPSLRSPPRM